MIKIGRSSISNIIIGMAQVNERVDRRLLMIGLDGFDISLANQFVEAGLMPNFERLRSQSVRAPLDCGRDRFSGLAWEHFSSGRSPSSGARRSAIHFGPEQYNASQKPTSARPFPADLCAKTVVFDVPYFELRLAPNVGGITNWGAHDPGVDSNSRPTTLHDEIRNLFGAYPAADFLYGFCWASEERTRRSSEALVHAVDLRRRVARWLLVERLSDWRLALVVVSECHSAVEPFWHGIDPRHPLHVLPSAKAAMTGLQNVYSAIDELIGGLAADCPDAMLVLFAPHGMGPNHADVAAMALLPELLYRAAFGENFMRSIRWARADSGRFHA
jgi:predicted AlkP superfamily phosphohydrolase/phosphomutase